jgi:hypothetical protein
MQTAAANTGYEAGLTGIRGPRARGRRPDQLRRSIDVRQVAWNWSSSATTCFDIRISEVIKLFNYADQVVKKPIEVQMTADVARGLLELDLAPSKIDIGRLTHEFANSRVGLHQ